MERKGLIFPDDYPLFSGMESHETEADYAAGLLMGIEHDTSELCAMASDLAGFVTVVSGKEVVPGDVDLEAIFHMAQTLEALHEEMKVLKAQSAQ